MHERIQPDDIMRRIIQLEQRRGELWSVAGGSQFAANMYREFLDGKRTPSDVSLALAAYEGIDLMQRYRNRMAAKIAAAAIAKARAKAITDELRRLRAAAPESSAEFSADP